MKAFPNKRKNKTPSIQSLFKVKDLDKLLEKEQRKEEIDKINEVKQQEKAYYQTLGACVFVMIILSCAALFGGYK